MNRLSKLGWTVTPLALVILCLILYGVFENRYVDDCNVQNANQAQNANKDCNPFDANMISRVENAEGYNASTARLSNINSAITNLKANLSIQNEAAEKIQANLNEKLKSIDNGKIAEVTEIAKSGNLSTNVNSINSNILALDAEKNQLNTNLTLTQTNANNVAATLKAKTDESVAIRKQYAERYSIRVLWIFLTALLVALSIGACIAGIHIIFKSQRAFVNFADDKVKAEKDADKITIIWIIITTVIALTVCLIAYKCSENLMEFSLGMLKQSLLNENVKEITGEALRFFTVFTFFGAIFLLSASCSVFYTAVSLEQKNVNPITSPPSADLDKTQLVKAYAGLLKLLRVLLYVGTFMLFVGILRLGYLMDWHLTFISTDPKNPLYELLNSFWKTTMTVQGGFYTILLAVIYLPAAYWINGKVSSMDVGQATLEEEGVSFNYTEILLKLVAILSPLLATKFEGKWLTFFNN